MRSERDKLLWALFINHRCNINCDYCYLRGLKDTRVIDRPTLYSILDFIHKMGLLKKRRVELGFFGKEPLLDFEIIEEAVSYIREKKYRFLLSINTNGLMLNEKYLGFLLKCDFKIVVSVDRFISKKDDLSLFKYFPKEDLRIRSTLNSRNVGFLERILSDFYEAGFKKISIAFDYTDMDLIKMEDEELIDIFTGVIVWYLNKKKRDRLLFVPFLDRIVSQGIEPIDRDYVKSPFCEICDKIFAIDINGDIYPCWRFVGNKRFRIGSISDGKIRRINNSITIKRDVADAITPFDYICFWAYKKGGYVLQNNLKILRVARQVSSLILKG